MNALDHILIAALLSICFHSNAQTFDWKQDGYLDHSTGGVFKNIDGSGINLTIKGLVNDIAHGTYVKTGKNDQQEQHQFHSYTFTFSESVDVEFTISEINLDTIKNCFDDELILSGNPMIIESNRVKIIGDTLRPNQVVHDFEQGHVKVSYHNINQFTIRHGSGKTCNPGYIMFSPIQFQKTQRLVQFGEDTLHYTDIQFELEQKNLIEEYHEKLDSLILLMQKDENKSVILLGFADDEDSQEKNSKLSRKRVNAVLTYLLLNGADRSRIHAQYFGDNISEISHLHHYGHGQNKRVELYIVN
ncbi:MAG: OmpA family protein [Crocinitomicaceae bacterium]|nr:OmpA family protein [Crocinitomicaceae bacterium]